MKRFFFLSLAIAIPLLSQSQWQPMNGPCGGTLYCFLQKNPYIFAATESHGVFRSNNAGSSWMSKNNGLANLTTRGLAATNSRIFAATQGGLFSSADNGDYWETVIINGMAGAEYWSVAANGNTVIATTASEVFRSPDDGITWSTVMTTTNSYMHAAMNGTDVYIGTGSTTFFYSQDDGLNFDQTDNCPFWDTFSFAFQGTKVFTAAYTTPLWSSGVFFSTDHGVGWNGPGNTMAFGPFNVAVNGNLVYASSLKYPFPQQGPGGLYVSSDDGINWTSIGLTDYSILPMAFSGNRLIAGAWPGGVFISDDDGSHWTESSNGLEQLPIMSIIKTGSLLYTVSGTEGILISDDDGQNWRHITSGLPGSPGPMIVQSTTLIAGAANQVFYSEDNGVNWDLKINTGYPITCFQVKGNSLFAGTDGGGIFLTNDHGLTWHSVNNGMNSMAIQAFTVKGSVIFTGTANGLYRSTDNGATWVPADHGLPDNDISSLAANSGHLFTAIPDYQFLEGKSAIFMSTDDGDTWERSGPEFDNFGYSVYFATDEQHIIAGVNGQSQVIFSDDDGQHWSVVNSGLPVNIWIQSLYISGPTLYATTSIPETGANAGIWKRALSELVAFSIQPDTVFLTSGQGNTANLSITSTTPWTIEGTMPNWLTTDIQGGQGTGTLTFSTRMTNPYPVPRFADIDIASLGTMRHVVVVQHENVNSLNEKVISGISLYPNPSEGLILLKADSPVSKAIVFNSLGQVVLEIPVTGNCVSIDLSGNQRGVYSIMVSGNSGCSIRRVIVL
jgi:photosystem II stability/assembly factor-like uncharacterized protein